MAARKILALAVLVAPLVSATPVQRREEGALFPTPTWWFPGRPTGFPGGGIHPDPVYPGGPIKPDPVYPGGSLNPDPVTPGAPIIADPASPGGELNPDDPSYGDDYDSALKVGRAVQDDPPPTFGFGEPAPPTLSPGPLTPGGPLEGDGGDSGWGGSFGALSPSPSSSPSSFFPRKPVDIDNEGNRAARRGVEDEAEAEAATVNSACTYTLDVASAAHLPAPCTWDGTLTQYASTATLVQSVNCQGCDHLRVVGDIYACPIFSVRGSTTIDTATTIFRTKCAASAAMATATAAQVVTAKPAAAGAAEPTAVVVL